MNTINRITYTKPKPAKQGEVTFSAFMWICAFGLVIYLIAKAFHLYELSLQVMPWICCVDK